MYPRVCRIRQTPLALISDLSILNPTIPKKHKKNIMTSLQTSKEHPKMKKQKNKTFMLGSEVCTQGSVGSDRPPLPSHQTSQLSTRESQKNQKTVMTSFETFQLSTPKSQSNRRNLITSLQTSQLSTPESQRNKKHYDLISDLSIFNPSCSTSGPKCRNGGP